MTIQEVFHHPSTVGDVVPGREPTASVALVNMPWASVMVPSISLGILKRCLAAKGIGAEVFYLNLRFAERLGDLDFFEAIPTAGLVGELFFAPHLRDGEGAKIPFKELLEREEIRRKFEAGLLGCYTGVDWEKLTEEVVPAFLQDCLDSIDWSSYRIVGFTSTFAQNTASLLLARRLKERFPDLSIVFGGPNVWGEMGAGLLESFDWVDFVVDGEAEETFPRLVANVLEGDPFRPLAGVSFRRDGEVVLHQAGPAMVRMDRSPAPDYDSYFAQLRQSRLSRKITPKLLIETSRGCWWGEKSHCTFCGLNGSLLSYRSKSPDRALEEILELTERHRVVELQAVDNILDMKYFRTVLPALEERGLDLRIFYEVKANLKREHMEALHRSGVRTIQPGIESLSTQLLKMMRKGSRAIHNMQILKWARELGISVLWGLIYGFPGEDPAEYAAMVDKLLLVSHCEPPYAVGRFILERFSPFHRDPAGHGIRDVRPDPLYPAIYPGDDVDRGKLAYYFDYSIDESCPDPEEYIAPVKQAVSLWHRLHAQKKAKLTMWKGPGFVEILDRRPRAVDDEQPAKRRIVLSGLAAGIYRHCDTARPLQEIQRFAEGRAGEAGARQAEEIVTGLVRNRLMYAEDGTYLSLAVAVR